MTDQSNIATNIELSAEQLEIVQDILRQHVPEREVWAFGSRAKHTAKKFSDLDLAVMGDAPDGFAQCAGAAPVSVASRLTPSCLFTHAWGIAVFGLWLPAGLTPSYL